MSLDHSEIVTYKLVGSLVSFLYFLCLIYQLAIKFLEFHDTAIENINVIVMQ